VHLSNTSITAQLLAHVGRKTSRIDRKTPLETNLFTLDMWNELVKFVNI
jgi:hypothetical protein